MISRGRLFLYRVVFGLALLAFWEFSAGRLIDPFWVSSPSAVFKYLYGVIADGSIFGHLAITLYETFTGFFIGAIVGIGYGLCARTGSEVLAQILDPYVVAFNGIPRIALAPLFIIWFGIGPTSKVILVISVVFFLTFFNTFAGVKGVDAELKNILRIMGASERQILDESDVAVDRAMDHDRAEDQFALRHRRCRGWRVHRRQQGLGLLDQLQHVAIFHYRRVGRHLRPRYGGGLVQRSDHAGPNPTCCAGDRAMNARTRANSFSAREGAITEFPNSRQGLARRPALQACLTGRKVSSDCRRGSYGPTMRRSCRPPPKFGSLRCRWNSRRDRSRCRQ